MSFWIAGAMVVTTVGGAIASKKAAKQNTAGVQSGLDQSKEITDKARSDVISLFDNSSKRANIGLQASLDFYKQNAQKRMQPFMQGNQAAQNVVGLGARQANNAILGLPVDMSFTNQPQVTADYSGIQGATLPVQGDGFEKREADKLAAEQAAEAAQNAQASGGITGTPTISGIPTKFKDVIDPTKVISNTKSIVKTLESKDPVKKLINKIF